MRIFVDNKNELISIITLSYNSPDLIKAIESVINQTYTQIQYIIVDDASYSFDKKSIEKIINQSNHIVDYRIIQHEENKGVIQSFCDAFQYAKGKYVFSLAGDDSFLDNYVIEEWVRYFEITKANVLTAYRSVYDEKLEHFIERKPIDKVVDKIISYSPIELFNSMAGYNYIFGCCTAYRYDILKKYMPIDNKYRTIEDYYLAIRLLRDNERIGFYHRSVIKYRSGGVSSNNAANKNYLLESDKLFKYEIKPYVVNKRKAVYDYNKWRKDKIRIIKRNKYSCLKQKTVNNIFKRFFVYVWYAFVLPRDFKNSIIRHFYR